MKSISNGIIHSESGDNFGVKAEMMGLSLEKQVELLNNLYADTLKFEIGSIGDRGTKDYKRGIRISKVLVDYNQIVLPNTRALLIEDVKDIADVIFSGESNSIVIPESIPELKVGKASWIRYTTRVFMYDTTQLDFTDFFSGPFDTLEMIIVKPLKKLAKPKIYRFK